MTKSFHLFLVFLCISIGIEAVKFTKSTQTSTPIARRRHSELDGFVVQKTVIYIWAGFTLFLCFATIFLLVLWIKDTVQLNYKVTELEKKIQDMEQYGVIKPPVPPLFGRAPEAKPEKEKTIVKVVNEDKTPVAKVEPTAPKKPENPEKIKQKTKKRIKKSTKNLQKQVENKNSKSVETDESKSSVSKEVSQSVTVDKTTEESKTTENTISKTVAEKEPEEPSFLSSIATAEVLELSRRRY